MNVYDFDNTIYDGETLVDFIMYYVKTDIKIWRYIPKLLWIYFKDTAHLFTVEEAIEAYAGFLEGYYVNIKTIDEDVKKFWDKNEHKIKPWYNDVRRDDDIIVSGTTDFILDEIMARMGVKNYVGSSIDNDTGKFKRLCFLDNKVKIFNELYPNAHIDNFYTDSMNDKPMMDMADHVYFVTGNKIEQIK
jgi:phosphoserine phosphatase